MKQNDEPQTCYAAFVGLDRSDKKINVSLRRCGKSKIERRIIKSGSEALHAWVAELCAQFPHEQVAICLEQPASGLIHALMGDDFIVLFPINPVTLTRYREAFTPSRAKDDPVDADLLCELVARHRAQLKAWQPDDLCTRKLRHLIQARRRSVNMRTRLSNQLKALLKGYFPQALELCGDDLTTPMACTFLQKWSSLQQLKKARPETIRRFYYAHNARRGDVIEKRLALLAQAMPLTNDPALIESSVITVQALVLGLRAVHTAILSYDRAIAHTFSQHPDSSLFAALPGSGTAYSARLLAAFGSRRELFPSAEAMLNFSGIAPVLKRSGQTTTIHRRYARPLFLHQSFMEYANESIRHSLWARAFYQRQKAANKTHWVIIRALAYKWIRILFRCWQERIPYDELRYLRSLHYFSTNPTHEVPNQTPTIAATATACRAAASAINAAQTASNQSNMNAGAAKKNLEDGIAAARSRLTGLRNELTGLIEPDDDLWYAFGFEKPSDPDTPEVPENLVLTPGAAGSRMMFVDWDDARRGESYRVTAFDTATPPNQLAEQIVHESEATFHLNAVAGGTAIKIVVTARNSKGGESGPSAPASGTVP